MPIIIGALGTIGKNFENWVKKIEMECSTELLQKACLLGTAKILRKVKPWDLACYPVVNR